jgi:acyl-CoA thioesterase-1
MIVGRGFAIIAVVALAAGCRGDGEAAPASSPAVGVEQSGGAGPAGPAGGQPAIVFLGTSLTAGYGLGDPSRAFPALIQRRLDSLGRGLRVVSAGISGETSAGALRRIDWVLGQSGGPVAVLVVETGANDGLRGQDPDSIRANIQAIFDRAKRLDPAPRLVLAGMEAMPNLGQDYARRFRALFPDLARANGAALIPFLLDGVAGVDSLNQEDGIHPTERGHRLVAENVWRVLRDVLDAAPPASPVPSGSPAPPAPPSPYAAHASREIKALSPEDIARLRAGEGMGLALAAELNHYPGPRHLLELGDSLGLSAEVLARVRRIRDAMTGRARALGERIVALESELDRRFAGRAIDAAEVARRAEEIGRLQGTLRGVHLAAHLEVAALLTADQIRRYDVLRGYGPAEHRHAH